MAPVTQPAIHISVRATQQGHDWLRSPRETSMAIVRAGGSMELISLMCQHCSAPLQVPVDAQFVTCRHCGTQLAVRRTASAAYTETLGQIDARTQRMEDQLDDLSRQNALAELDRDWDREREQFYVTTKNNGRQLPTTTSSVLGGVVVVVAGLAWMMFASQIDGQFALFGLLFIAAGLGGASLHYVKATNYERAQRKYRRRRTDMLRKADGD